MGLSPEQREIERKERELKLQDDRLKRRLEQQQRLEDKLTLSQEKITDREKKTADAERALKDREAQLSKQLGQLQGDQGQHTAELQRLDKMRRRRLSFMLPVLLLAGVGSGYLTYDYYAKNDIFSQRLSQANKNVNKLSLVLTQAEDNKTEALQKLTLKEDALVQAQGELEKLKIAYARLDKEKLNSDGSRTTLESSNKTLETTVGSLTKEKEDLEQMVKQLDSALTEQKNLATSLSKQVENLTISLDEKEVALSLIENHEAELVIVLEEKTGVLIAAKQAIDERDKIIAAKVKRQSELELELASLKEEQQQFSTNRDLLVASIAEKTELLETLKSEQKNGQANSAEIVTQLDSLKVMLDKAEADLKAEQQKRQALEKQIADVPKVSEVEPELEAEAEVAP